MEIWEIVLYYMSKHIHLASANIAVYVELRYNVFRNIIIMNQGIILKRLSLVRSPLYSIRLSVYTTATIFPGGGLYWRVCENSKKLNFRKSFSVSQNLFNFRILKLSFLEFSPTRQ